MTEWTQHLIDLPYAPALLVKITVLLAAAWIAHASLHQANPRWRVFLWRAVVVGLIFLPLAQWYLPSVEVAMSAPAATTIPASSPPSSAETPPMRETETAAISEPITSNPAAPPVHVSTTEPFTSPESIFVLSDWLVEHRFGMGMAAWLFVSAIFLFRTAIGWRRVRQRVAMAEAAPDSIKELAVSIAADLGLRNDVTVRTTAERGSPYLAGIRRPVIVLPEHSLANTNSQHLRAVLAHELSHVKGRDPFWIGLVHIVCCLLWFHPLSWRVRVAHTSACEEVCDGVATAYVGNAETYSKALAQEALAFLNAQPAPGAVPMLRKADIIRRVHKIQRGIRVDALRRRWIVAGLMCAAILLAALGSLRLVQAEDQEDSADGWRSAEDFENPGPVVMGMEIRRVLRAPESRVGGRLYLRSGKFENEGSGEGPSLRWSKLAGIDGDHAGVSTDDGMEIWVGPTKPVPGLKNTTTKAYPATEVAATDLMAVESAEDLPPAPERNNANRENGYFIGPLGAPARELQPYPLPYQYAFESEDGDIGVFEITKAEDRDIYIRYKLFARGPAAENFENDVPVQVGTEVRRILRAADVGAGAPLLLRSGEFVDKDEDEGPYIRWTKLASIPGDHAGISATGIDLWTGPTVPVPGMSDPTKTYPRTGVAATDLLAINDPEAVPEGPEELRSPPKGLFVGPLGAPARDRQPYPLPFQYVFASNEGDLGVLEITKVENRDVFIRYKMLAIASLGDDDATTEAVAGSISGVVLNEAGEPIAGALVDAWTWTSGSETHTDDEGRFTLSGLSSERAVELRISKAGYAPFYKAQHGTGLAGIEFVLDDDTYIEGQVVGQDGEPAAGAVIRADSGPIDADGVTITSVWTETTADDEGRYRLYLHEGEYDVHVKDDANGVFRGPLHMLPDEPREMDYQLQEGVIFRARVFEAAGPDDKGEADIARQPAVGVKFDNFRHPGVVGVSDANGVVEIASLYPGEFEFDVESDEHMRWWSPDAEHVYQQYYIDDEKTGWQRNFGGLTFNLQPNMEPVTIIVEPAVTVRGKVVDPGGNPVEGARVTAARTGTGNSLTGDTRFRDDSDADGSFEVKLPASKAAQYNLFAHDGDYGEWRNWANAVGEPIRTEPGQVINDVVLQFNRGGTIRGVVTNEEGEAVAHADVRAQAYDKLGNRYYDPTTKTAEDGSFELTHVRPGRHYVQVEPFWLTAEQAPELSTAIVDVAANEVVEGVSIVQAKQQNIPELAPESGTKTGDEAKPFTSETLQGAAINLEDYRGKVVLLDFWATWCGPCVDELPHVIETYEKLHEKGLEVIGISLDTDRGALETFLAEHPKMKWPQIFEGKGWQSEIATLYGVRSIPFTVLIDENGEVRFVKLRGGELLSAAEAMVEAAAE